MTVIRLAAASLVNRKVTALLTVLCIAVSVAMLLGVEKLRRDGRSAFANTISGTDLVVGAPGGGVQLLLYSIFRIGNATSNVSSESFERLSADPRVQWAVPLSLGDSHKGFRVLGTNVNYFKYYQYGQRKPLEFKAGKPFTEIFDTVIGAEVASALQYGIGSKLVLAHGAGELTIDDHEDQPFRVIGVLRRTGTPVDQTVHISLAGMEAIHEGWEDGRPPSALHALTHKRYDKSHRLEPESITAFLLGVKRKTDLFSLQREINTRRDEPLQAVIPGVALQQLWDLFAVAENLLKAISWLVVATGLTNMLIIILSTLEARRREMAVLRAVGATPLNLVGLFVAEAMLLATAGIVVGVALLYVSLLIVRPIVSSSLGLSLPVSWLTGADILLLLAVLTTALIAGLVPAWRATRLALADGLSVRL